MQLRSASGVLGASLSTALRTRWCCALALLVATAALAVSVPAAHAAPPARGLVLVIADDLTTPELAFLPRTMEYMVPRGMRLDTTLASSAVCCPSRANILTGKYAQNTGVFSNSPPFGGFEAFFLNGMEARTLPMWLQAAGWTNGLVGKYLNGYGASTVVPRTHVPAGWDHWVAYSGDIKYYDYTLNENGRIVTYGAAPADYATDVLAARAQGVLGTMLAQSRPFFLMLTPFAPHLDNEGVTNPDGDTAAVPAPRHAALFDGLKAPRSGAFNRCQLTPTGARRQQCGREPLTAADIDFIDHNYRRRAQSLQSLDEMFAAVVAQLQAAGVLANTHIVFMSDNGFAFGDHWYDKGKGRLYDGESRIPMLVAGPGVAPGKRALQLVANIDVAPTLAALAGIAPPADIDGRSIVPLLNPAPGAALLWRRGVLEHAAVTTRLNVGRGVRGMRYAYIERYSPAGRRTTELYDLNTDPDQVDNLASRLTTTSAAALVAATDALARCAGAACRQLEDAWDESMVVFRP